MSVDNVIPRKRPLALLLLALLPGLATPAMAQDGDDANLAIPGEAACSTRYPLVAAPAPAAQAEDPKTAIRDGFGTRRDWGTEDNVELLAADETGLDEAGLRVHYPAGTSSPGDTEKGGAGFYAAPGALAGADRACLQYRVRFASGFDFVKGGKLPGLFGGEAPSGGEEADGENGFSMRYMWRADGQGELYEYAVDQDEDYGKSVGRGAWTFPTGQWVTLEQEIVLNDPGRDNGLARVWVDGRPILEQRGIVYRTSEAVTIDGLMFSTFFGGSGEEWRTPRDQHADFAGFRLHAPRS